MHRDLLQNAKPDSSVLHPVNDIKPIASLPEDLWTVLGHSKYTSTTSLIQLKAAQYRVKLACKGIDWLGKHYIVCNSHKARPYTNCTSLSPENIKYMKALTEAYHQSKEQKQV